MNKFLILATLFAASANAYTPIPRLEGFQEFLDNCICKEYKYHEERIRHVKDIEESVNFVVSGSIKDIEESVNFVVSGSIKDTLPSGKVVFRHIPEICCTRAQMDGLRTEIYAWKERCEKACPSFIPECDCGIPNARLLCTMGGADLKEDQKEEAP